MQRYNLIIFLSRLSSCSLSAVPFFLVSRPQTSRGHFCSTRYISLFARPTHVIFMHGSIPTVIIPPGYTPGNCNFFFTWRPIPRPRAQRKRQLPTRGTLVIHWKRTAPFHKKKDIFYGNPTFYKIDASEVERISRHAGLVLLPSSFNLDKLFLQPIAYKLKGFPSKEVHLRPAIPCGTGYFNYPTPYSRDKTTSKILHPRATKGQPCPGRFRGGGGGGSRNWTMHYIFYLYLQIRWWVYSRRLSCYQEVTWKDLLWGVCWNRWPQADHSCQGLLCYTHLR